MVKRVSIDDLEHARAILDDLSAMGSDEPERLDRVIDWLDRELVRRQSRIDTRARL